MLRSCAFLLAASLAASLSAQTPACLGFNDGNTTVSNAVTSYGFAGENSLAWQITRAPEFQCPILAAKCMARGKLDFAYRREALAAIDEAIGRMPETFDTGDGIVLFGHEMRRARETIATGGRVIYDIFKQ